MSTLSPDQIRAALFSKTEQEILSLADLSGVSRRTLYRLKAGDDHKWGLGTTTRVSAALCGIKTEKGATPAKPADAGDSRMGDMS